MPLRRHPMLSPASLWGERAAWILTATLGCALPAPPVAAEEITQADAIVRGLYGEPSPSRGIRPHTKAPRTIDLTIHFATNSAVIAPRSRDQIREIATAARQLNLKRFQLLIIGHSDSRGPADYNLALSQRRAQAVKKALVNEHGLPDADLRAEGKGESEQLVSPERDAADYARNRRVELRLVQHSGSNR